MFKDQLAFIAVERYGEVERRGTLVLRLRRRKGEDAEDDMGFSRSDTDQSEIADEMVNASACRAVVHLGEDFLAARYDPLAMVPFAIRGEVAGDTLGIIVIKTREQAKDELLDPDKGQAILIRPGRMH